ncbi:MAG: hypothetical protein IJ776_08085 [Paludibacteraceae bacterium]|nr:hypothetical protein [Paludibacteraceae bacterium]
MKHLTRTILILSLIAVLSACNGNPPVLPQATGTENGHEYVDLGLSVNWATTNVGATAPEDYGWYICWAETAEKDNYDWKTYKYGKSTRSLTKYNTSKDCGPVVDSLLTLEPEDDAATVNWGGRWRTPTKAEWLELIDNCKWQTGKLNDVKGFYFTAPNGNSIFLPLAGIKRLDKTWWEAVKDDEDLNLGMGKRGLYQSASLQVLDPPHVPTPYYSWTLRVSDDKDGKDVYRVSGSRATGQSFRPVLDK